MPTQSVCASKQGSGIDRKDQLGLQVGEVDLVWASVDFPDAGTKPRHLLRGRSYGDRQDSHGIDALPDGPPISSLSGHVVLTQTASRLATSATSSPRRAHSQTIATLQPDLRSASSFRRSRSTLATNLEAQNSGRVAGTVQYRQPAWRCQKQPFTKIATLRFGRTISGRPGRSLR